MDGTDCSQRSHVVACRALSSAARALLRRGKDVRAQALLVACKGGLINPWELLARQRHGVLQARLARALAALLRVCAPEPAAALLHELLVHLAVRLHAMHAQ